MIFETFEQKRSPANDKFRFENMLDSHFFLCQRMIKTMVLNHVNFWKDKSRV